MLDYPLLQSNSNILLKMGMFRIRLDALIAECMPRMIVCLAKHRSKK